MSQSVVSNEGSDMGFSDAQEKALRYCSLCPKLCRHACPVAHGEARETSTPWGLMRLLHFVERGDVEVDEFVQETLYRCVSCGRCQSFCKHENPVAETLARGRAALLEQGRAVPAPYAEAADACRRSAVLRPRAADVVEAPILRISCRSLASEADAARVESALDHLEGAGLLFRVVAEEPSLRCGFRDWEVGRTDAAIEAWDVFSDRAGGHRVITDCASGLWLAREVREDVEDNAIHILEWVSAHLSELPAGSLPGRVAIHDSCFSGRRLGLDEVIRDVVRYLTGSDPMSLFESGDKALCCGSQGVWAEAHPEAAARAAEAVAEDVRDGGFDVLFTASASCRKGLQAQLGDAVRVVDLWDLLNALPQEP